MPRAVSREDPTPAHLQRPMLLRSVWADLALSRSLDSPPLCPIVGAFPGFPECLASAMAASSWRGAVLFRTVSGLWQPGPDAAREWMTRLPSLLGCQRRCVSCVAGPTFSGPRLASASRPNGQNSALDCFLGLSQPDNSLPFRVPAVSVHRGKECRLNLSATVTTLRL